MDALSHIWILKASEVTFRDICKAQWFSAGSFYKVWRNFWCQVISTTNGQCPKMPPSIISFNRKPHKLKYVNCAEVEQTWNSTSRRVGNATSQQRVWGGGREGLAADQAAKSWADGFCDGLSASWLCLGSWDPHLISASSSF